MWLDWPQQWPRYLLMDGLHGLICTLLWWQHERMGELMKVFVWHRIDQATDNFHRAGGIVVFAETEERARKIAHRVDSDGSVMTHIAHDEHPNEVRELAEPAGPEMVYVMPDAGCC